MAWRLFFNHSLNHINYFRCIISSKCRTKLKFLTAARIVYFHFFTVSTVQKSLTDTSRVDRACGAETVDTGSIPNQLPCLTFAMKGIVWSPHLCGRQVCGSLTRRRKGHVAIWPRQLGEPGINYNFYSRLLTLFLRLNMEYLLNFVDWIITKGCLKSPASGIPFFFGQIFTEWCGTIGSDEETYQGPILDHRQFFHPKCRKTLGLRSNFDLRINQLT